MRRRAVQPNSSPLVEAVVTGKWKDVVELCKSDPDLRSARVTISGDTALHMAILDGQTKTVQQLVELVRNDAEQARKALTAANERGNTPLHLAAEIGNSEMCRFIAEVDLDRLIACRNHDGETPLFLAVLHGMESAFLYLLRCTTRGERPDYSLCVRNDGNTIIHSAIYRYKFDMAIIIIHTYPDLVDAVNEDGYSPLHILATKPSTFRSTWNIRGLPGLLYDRISVDESTPRNYFVQPGFSDSGYGKKDSSQRSDEEDPSNTEQIHHKESDRGRALVGTNWFKVTIEVLFKAVLLITLTVLSLLIPGGRIIRRLENIKQMHIRSVQLLDALFQRTSMYKTPGDGIGIEESSVDRRTPTVDRRTPKPLLIAAKNGNPENDEIEIGIEESSVERRTPKPLLIAAKNGITEIVERYLERFPIAIFERDQAMKNVVLLAVEHRQPLVYKLLLDLMKTTKDILFRQVDGNGNSVLHLAAKLGDENRTRLNKDAVLIMHSEIRWFQHVRHSIPVGSSVRLNSEGKTAHELLSTTHESLVKVSAEWLVHVSESCSFVAALVATVAFATSATIPGGVKQDSGTPALKDEPAFYVFAISSLVALCFSVTSTVTFLSIMTSGFRIEAFHTSLPRKLLAGLVTLCVSIIAMMVSFCASHFFLLKDKLSYWSFWIYGAMPLMPLVTTILLIPRFPHSDALMVAALTNIRLVIPLPEQTNEM